MIATSEADTHDSTHTETDLPNGTTPLIDLRIGAASWGATAGGFITKPQSWGATLRWPHKQRDTAWAKPG